MVSSVRPDERAAKPAAVAGRPRRRQRRERGERDRRRRPAPPGTLWKLRAKLTAVTLPADERRRDAGEEQEGERLDRVASILGTISQQELAEGRHPEVAAGSAGSGPASGSCRRPGSRGGATRR